MFNKNFYPSSDAAKRLFRDNIIGNAKSVLEPSAGKGDLVEVIKNHTNCKNVAVIEIDDNLAAILEGKGDNLVSSDFLQYETYTEYDAIIMNPPFDAGDKHLLKAIELATKQVSKPCQILALINAETIDNPYSQTRKVLSNALKAHNAKISFHENLFSEAERKTNVRCAFVQMKIDCTKNTVDSVFGRILNDLNNKNDSENVSSMTTALSINFNKNEVSKKINDILKLVKQYEYHVSLVKQVFKAKKSLDYFSNIFNSNNTCTLYNSFYDEINDELNSIRSTYWEEILKTNEFRSKLPGTGREILNKMLENVVTVEINIQNIEQLLLALMQNSSEILMNASVDTFMNLTKYHNKEFSKNVHYFNGWDTNNAYKINKKIIIPFFGSSFGLYEMGGMYREEGYSFENITYKVKDFLQDLTKTFKLLGFNFEEEFTMSDFGKGENGYFRFQMFQKGTIHIWFKDFKMIDYFNLICGQKLNWLPSNEEVKTNINAQTFMQEQFENYNELLKLA